MPDSSLPRNFVVYLITCIPTGMQYIGITTQPLRKRWNNHLNGGLSGRQMTPLHKTIARLGPGEFTMEPIFSAFTVRDLLESEKLLIAQWGTMAPRGFNLSFGGNIAAFTRTPESIERSAVKHRGVPRHPEVSERAACKIRGTKKPDGFGAKISAARLGKKNPPDVCAKISAGRTGKSNNPGEINGQAKLTADQVRETRTRLESGESQRSIARSFGIHYSAIWKIKHGLKWKSVA